MKNIIVSNAYALAVCHLKYGRDNNYFYLSAIPISSRHKGRNFDLQHKILLETASLLNIVIQGVTEEYITNLMLNNDLIVIDWRLKSVIKKFHSLAEMHATKSEMNRTIEVFVNGADFLQSFSPKYRDLFGPRILKDNRLWRKELLTYGRATFIFPGFSKFSKKPKRFDRVEFVSREDLSLGLQKLAQDLICALFPNMGLSFDSELIIVNPETSIFELFEEQVPEYILVLNSFLNSKVTILKLHPSTVEPEKYIHSFRSHFDGQLGLSAIENFDLLTAFPLELFLIGFPNSKYVGFHSTSTSVIDSNRLRLIDSLDHQINKTVGRSFHEFYRLMNN